LKNGFCSISIEKFFSPNVLYQDETYSLIRSPEGIQMSVDQKNTLVLPTKNIVSVYSHPNSFCHLFEEIVNVFSDVEKKYYSYCNNVLKKILETKEVFQYFSSPREVVIGNLSIDLYTNGSKDKTTHSEFSNLGSLTIEKPLKISSDKKILFEDKSIIDFFHLVYKNKIFIALKEELLLIDLTNQTVEKKKIKVQQMYYAGMVFIENSQGIYKIEEIL
jgi:hypothetical protein